VSDKIIDGQTVEEVTTETLEKTKTFTQAELDKIVSERLSREKTVAKKTIDDLAGEKGNLETMLAKYEEEFKKVIEPQLESVPEEYRVLIDKLPLLEKLEFISNLAKKNNEGGKRQIPQTPAKSGQNEVVHKPIGKII